MYSMNSGIIANSNVQFQLLVVKPNIPQVKMKRKPVRNNSFNLTVEIVQFPKHIRSFSPEFHIIGRASS